MAMNIPWYEPQDAVRPREAHDGQADVLREEQHGRLLPTTGAVLDGGLGLGGLLLVEDGAAVVRVLGEVGGQTGEDGADAAADDDVLTAEPLRARRGGDAKLGVSIVVAGVDVLFVVVGVRHGRRCVVGRHVCGVSGKDGVLFSYTEDEEGGREYIWLLG